MEDQFDSDHCSGCLFFEDILKKINVTGGGRIVDCGFCDKKTDTRGRPLIMLSVYRKCELYEPNEQRIPVLE